MADVEFEDRYSRSDQRDSGTTSSGSSKKQNRDIFLMITLIVVIVAGIFTFIHFRPHTLPQVKAPTLAPQ